MIEPLLRATRGVLLAAAALLAAGCAPDAMRKVEVVQSGTTSGTTHAAIVRAESVDTSTTREMMQQPRPTAPPSAGRSAHAAAATNGATPPSRPMKSFTS